MLHVLGVKMKKGMEQNYFPGKCYQLLTLSCPGMGRAVVKIDHSNLWHGSKELLKLM